MTSPRAVLADGPGVARRDAPVAFYRECPLLLQAEPRLSSLFIIDLADTVASHDRREPAAATIRSTPSPRSPSRPAAGLYDLVVASGEPVGRDDAVGGPRDQPRARRVPPRPARRGRPARDRVPPSQRSDRARAPGGRPSSTDERTARSRSRSRPAATTARRTSWRRHSIGSPTRSGDRGRRPVARERARASGSRPRRAAGRPAAGRRRVAAAARSTSCAGPATSRSSTRRRHGLPPQLPVRRARRRTIAT